MIVLTCRNNIDLSKKCMETLRAQRSRPRILVADNASYDGTGQWVANMKILGVFGVSYREPVSVSHMWNRELGFVWRRGFDRALVVNNDTELMPDTYDFLSGALDASGAGMVTCVSVREREKLILPESGVEMTPHPDYSCFMIAKWAHELVRFDEHFVGAYLEDCDHHVEMHRAGIRALNTGLPFLHHGSMTIKTASAQERLRIEQNAAKNREYFFRKYGCYPGTKGYEGLFR